MLALKRFGAFLMWCIVGTSIYVAAVLVANVVEGDGPWFDLPLAVYVCLAVTVVQRWVWPRIAGHRKPSRAELVLPPPSPNPPVCADETHQANLEDDEGWYPWMERMFGADYARLMAEAPYVPRHLHIKPTRRHVAPPDFIPEQRSDPPK